MGVYRSKKFYCVTHGEYLGAREDHPQCYVVRKTEAKKYSSAKGRLS